MEERRTGEGEEGGGEEKGSESPPWRGGEGGSTSMAERRSMSSVVQARTQTLRERGAEATRRLREALQIAPDLNDATILGTALAEYGAERSQSDPRIAQELRRRYDELIAQSGRGAKRVPRQKE